MPELYQHQREGVEFLRTHPRAALFDEPGLGKSAQALLAAEEPTLVVAPAMVLDSGTWDDEVEKWAPGADVTQVAYSSLTTRVKTGRFGSKPTADLSPEYAGIYGTAVFDESHYLKGRKTHWTVAARKVDATRVNLLTGTPIPNWAHEAFTSLQLLFPEESRAGGCFGSYWRWAREWFNCGPTYSWSGRQLSPMAVQNFREDRTWEEFRRENWRDRTLLRLREDCIDLPPLTVQQWRCPMAPEQRRIYRALKKDFVAWLGSGEEVVAWNSAAQLVKLAKVATGVEVLDSGSRSSGKLARLAELLMDRPRPTLVVAHFRDSVAACARVAADVGSEAFVVDGGTSRPRRREIIRSFQRGDLPVLCATIDVIAEGMTLTAADQVIRVERSWRPSKNEQVLRRLHRIGQTRPVLAIDLVTPASVDIRVLELLAAKSDEEMNALGKRELARVVRD